MGAVAVCRIRALRRATRRKVKMSCDMSLNDASSTSRCSAERQGSGAGPCFLPVRFRDDTAGVAGPKSRWAAGLPRASSPGIQRRSRGL